MNPRYKIPVPAAVVSILIIALIVVLICARTSIFRASKMPPVSHIGNSVLIGDPNAAMIGGLAMQPMFSYHDDKRAYGFGFPQALVITNKTAQFPDRSVTAVFPDNFFTLKPSTLDRAEVYAKTTTYSCDEIDPLNSFASDTKDVKLPAITTKDGLTLDFNEFHDAGAGNLYDTYEYSITRDGECIRIGILDHQANPGVVYQDQASIQTATDDNATITSSLLTILYKIAGTFSVDPVVTK